MRSRATDGRSASKCQGKWPDQLLNQRFGLPALTAEVRATRLSFQNAGRAQKFALVRGSYGEFQFIREGKTQKPP
jgi:hypothetical protein